MKDTLRCRGKSIDTRSWVYGFPVYSVNDKCYIILNATEDAINTLNEVDFVFVEVDPKTVGRYIGMNDANDIEIYEHDIVRKWWGFYWDRGDKYCYHQIVFDRGSVGPCYGGNVMSWLLGGCYNLWEGNEVEVMGNIFDNSDLDGKEEFVKWEGEQ